MRLSVSEILFLKNFPLLNQSLNQTFKLELNVNLALLTHKSVNEMQTAIGSVVINRCTVCLGVL